MWSAGRPLGRLAVSSGTWLSVGLDQRQLALPTNLHSTPTVAGFVASKLPLTSLRVPNPFPDLVWPRTQDFGLEELSEENLNM
mmetsp:Transcript_68097/g.120469  ORF Transcript_68097/g.120469 Transcript_68097/m.120469 type:complete len:83 (+) Transcript_68097:306-554(+)